MTPPVLPHDLHGDRFITYTVAGSTAVALAGIAAQLVDYGAFGLRIGVLDSSTDAGAFGVVGDIAAASAAAAAWLLLVRARPRSIAVVVLPALMTFLSIDKILRIHDHIPHYLVFYAPVVTGTFVGLVVVLRGAPRPASWLLGVGTALLGASFTLHLAGEQILSALALGDVEWVRQAKVALKHACEVEGWCLTAIALTSEARRRPPKHGRNSGTRATGRDVQEMTAEVAAHSAVDPRR